MCANILSAALLLSAGGAYGYVRYREGQLKTQLAPHIVAAGPAPKGSGGLPPMNILLIGNNTRTGLKPSEASFFGSPAQVGGARSDVTMVLHLDPVRNTASLLSIPRDLFVSLPPHSLAGPYGKVDAGLDGQSSNPAATGPDNLIQTIEDDLGIPINHFISINFDGFQQTINDIGGIKMSFATQLYDKDAGLNITKTGCQLLNGAQALAVVRSRHLQYMQNGRWLNDPESDLARIVRDHIFLRVFVDTARAKLHSIFAANALIGGLLQQVTVDPGLTPQLLLELYKHYRTLNVNTVPETTLPITTVTNYHYAGGTYGDVDMPVEPLDHQVIDKWAGAPLPSSPPPAVSVRVVNRSGSYQAGAAMASGLAGLGYHVTGPAYGTPLATVSETVLHYHPGSAANALGVLHNLAGAVMLHADPSVAAGTVVVDVGTAVSVNIPAPAAQGGSAAATAPATSQATPTTPTTLVTIGNQNPSPAADHVPFYDPKAC